MSQDSTSDTMQAYLTMLLGGGESPARDERDAEENTVPEKAIAAKPDEGIRTDSTMAEEKRALSESNGACSQPDTTRFAHGHTQRDAARTSNGNGSGALSRALLSEVSQECNAPVDLAHSKAFDPQEQQQRQLESSDTGMGRPRVPSLQETEALREEQKRRLQKLLSQQPLKTATKTQTKADTSQPETRPSPEMLAVPEAPAAAPQKTHVGIEKAVSQNEPSGVNVDAGAEVDGTFHSAQAHKLEWHENGRPYWGQERFDALLFDVSGLTLAVPLVALGQIVRIEQGELTPIFGQTDWFMGLLESNVGRLRVINTALFVMPEKYDARFLDSAEYAISLDGVSWALAVDRVNQPISLDPAEIKWRTERSKRPWLAGTVKSQMCALLDVPQMANLLNQSDKTLS